MAQLFLTDERWRSPVCPYATLCASGSPKPADTKLALEGSFMPLAKDWGVNGVGSEALRESLLDQTNSERLVRYGRLVLPISSRLGENQRPSRGKARSCALRQQSLANRRPTILGNLQLRNAAPTSVPTQTNYPWRLRHPYRAVPRHRDRIVRR